MAPPVGDPGRCAGQQEPGDLPVRRPKRRGRPAGEREHRGSGSARGLPGHRPEDDRPSR